MQKQTKTNVLKDRTEGQLGFCEVELSIISLSDDFLFQYRN